VTGTPADSAPEVTAVIRKLRHDLSNPLAAVLAEAQLILLNADALDAETVSGARQIEALARKMRDILERVG